MMEKEATMAWRESEKCGANDDMALVSGRAKIGIKFRGRRFLSTDLSLSCQIDKLFTLFSPALF